MAVIFNNGKAKTKCLTTATVISVIATLALAIPVAANEVISDFYREPGVYPNRDYVNQHINEHIDPFTGSLQLHAVDVHIPGDGGLSLDVVRSYNSATVDYDNPFLYHSPAGLGWTIHFGRVLRAKDNFICSNLKADTVIDNPTLELPSGGKQLLYFTQGSGAPMALTTQRWKADCASNGAGLIVTSPTGIRYEMTHVVVENVSPNPIYSWYTKKISDRNGNSITVNYLNSTTSEISTVTASDGRKLTFTYNNSGSTNHRIATITGATGQNWKYNYTAIPNVASQYFLTEVVRPDSRSWKYSYNANLGNTPGSFLLKDFTYPQGGKVSYTYAHVFFDSASNPYSLSTVVKTKATSDGGNWSFTYKPGNFNVYDETEVITPSGKVVYKHIGPHHGGSGSVWKVGLLVEKQIGTVQTETYTWDKQVISPENYLRPGAFVTKVDLESYAPILTQKKIVRDGVTYNTTFSEFDAYGNPGKTVESGPNGGSKTTNTTYYINTSKWIVNQVSDETTVGAGTVDREWTANGNLASISVDGVKTSYTYTANGNVETVTRPRALKSTFSDHKRGVPQSESHPEGISISRVVNDAGNVTSETNGEGYTTTYAYDGLNRITGITYPANSAVSITYATTTTTATRGSLTEVTNLDTFGRPTKVTTAGVATSFSYDALGRKTFESNPGSTQGRNFAYDELDRITKITNADGSSRNYTHSGSNLTFKDERTNATVFKYRSYGNPDEKHLIAVTAPEASASFTLERNGRNLVTSIKQDGWTRTYGYDTRYYLTSEVHPETGTTTYGRDDAGNLTSRKVGTSGTTTYSYDNLNRLKTITYPNGTPSVTKTYSKTDKLLSVSSSAATRTYSYDSNDNLTTENLNVSGNVFEANYQYDNNDNLSSIQYPRSNRTVSYSPDDLGRPTKASPYVTNATYWPSGQLKAIDYANGTNTTYQQNSRLWASSFVTKKASTTYSNQDYKYDLAGNLTSITDTV